MGTFKPFLNHHPGMDRLTYYEEDCSVTEERIPGSNIVLLRNSTTGEIVGVSLENAGELLRKMTRTL